MASIVLVPMFDTPFLIYPALANLRRAQNLFGVWRMTTFVMLHERRMFLFSEYACVVTSLELRTILAMLCGSVKSCMLPGANDCVES